MPRDLRLLRAQTTVCGEKYIYMHREAGVVAMAWLLPN